MGSIPLVALAGRRQPPPVDPVESYNSAVQTGQQQQAGNQQLLAGQQQLESGAMDLQAKKQALADQQTIMRSLAENNGDLEKALPQLAGKVTPQSFQALANFHLSTKKTLSEIADNDLKVQQDQHDRTVQLLQDAAKLPDDQYAQQWPQIAQRNNEINPQHPLDPRQPMPKAQLPATALGLQTQEVYLKQEAERREQATAATVQQKNVADANEANAKAQYGAPVDQQELKSFMAAPPKGYKATPAEFARWKASLNPTMAVMGNMLGGKGTDLQPSALDQAAQRYSKTGELPAGFSRSPGTTAAIVRRAAELNPSADIAANKATFKADSAALSKLQTQFEQVNAFEGTALKNIDLALEKARAIPDLKVRFANTPVRLVSDKMIGTQAMAEFRTALLTAQTEAAKVLNSANANGVLSDSARHELEDLVSGNLPYPAMEGSFNTLKQDMGNRRQSYADDISAIKQRLNGPSSSGSNAPPVAPGAGDFFSKFGGKARTP